MDQEGPQRVRASRSARCLSNVCVALECRRACDEVRGRAPPSRAPSPSPPPHHMRSPPRHTVVLPAGSLHAPPLPARSAILTVSLTAMSCDSAPISSSAESTKPLPPDPHAGRTGYGAAQPTSHAGARARMSARACTRVCTHALMQARKSHTDAFGVRRRLTARAGVAATAAAAAVAAMAPDATAPLAAPAALAPAPAAYTHVSFGYPPSAGAARAAAALFAARRAAGRAASVTVAGAVVALGEVLAPPPGVRRPALRTGDAARALAASPALACPPAFAAALCGALADEAGGDAVDPARLVCALVGLARGDERARAAALFALLSAPLPSSSSARLPRVSRATAVQAAMNAVAAADALIAVGLAELEDDAAGAADRKSDEVRTRADACARARRLRRRCAHR